MRKEIFNIQFLKDLLNNIINLYVENEYFIDA